MNDDQAVEADAVPAQRGTSWARSRDYPNGSTSALRGDVLAALGVLKVATADQLQRIVRPHLRSNKAVRAALLDLGLYGLTVSDGRTADREKLWRLTGPGLEAAAEVLPTGRDLGGTARGAGRSGAPHSMMVNETIIAVLQGGTTPLAGPGTGTIIDWSTEVVHDVGPRLRAITDAVLRAPQNGVPVLLVEVDRGTMTAEAVAAKFERYRRFFERTVRDGDGDHRAPYWHRQYDIAPARTAWADEPPYPPVALVYGGNLGPAALDNRLHAVERLSRPYWAPQATRGYGDEYYNDYAGRIPILATTLERLRTYGLTGPAWHRHGHDEPWQTLTHALTDPDGKQAWRAREQRKRDEQQRRRAEEDARRCPTCDRPPASFADPADASDGETDCAPCRQDAAEQAAAEQAAADRAEALRQAHARDRCATCATGLVENDLLADDPEAIECAPCYRRRQTAGRAPLRRPAQRKRRLFG
ncbi:replication-relaxation family protein [Kitasatospora sp. NPDC008115]|uniref:replication-relaxation family protein n=1 Tax=Kitasatospora sp. NPDC008115 TaxID=3364022 RepID=UPI0036EFC0A8